MYIFSKMCTLAVIRYSQMVKPRRHFTLQPPGGETAVECFGLNVAFKDHWSYSKVELPPLNYNCCTSTAEK